MKFNSIDEILLEELKKRVKEKRFKHTMRMVDFSKELCKKNDFPFHSVKTAVLLHDLFRDLSEDEMLRTASEMGIKKEETEIRFPVLLHGKIASEYFLKYFGNENNAYEISEAVKYHTSGYSFSSLTGKILFVSDSLEYGRDFKGLDKLRNICFEDINRGYIEVLKNKICYAVKKGLFVLSETVKTYNELGVLRNEQYS